MGKRTRREHILAAAEDLISNFLYYDRKEDEDLPREAIEEAIAAGEVTVDELLAIFAAPLLLAQRVTLREANAAGSAFQVTFEEANALVASHLSEASVNTHAAGLLVAKVMEERMRRMRVAAAKRTGKAGA